MFSIFWKILIISVRLYENIYTLIKYYITSCTDPLDHLNQPLIFSQFPIFDPYRGLRKEKYILVNQVKYSFLSYF